MLRRVLSIKVILTSIIKKCILAPIAKQFPFLFLSLQLPILNPFFFQFSLSPSHFHKHLPSSSLPIFQLLPFLPLSILFLLSYHSFSPTFTPFSSSSHLFSPTSHTSFPTPISISPSYHLSSPINIHLLLSLQPFLSQRSTLTYFTHFSPTPIVSPLSSNSFSHFQ